MRAFPWDWRHGLTLWRQTYMYTCSTMNLFASVLLLHAIASPLELIVERSEACLIASLFPFLSWRSM
jgi:hypothetical protein